MKKISTVLFLFSFLLILASTSSAQGRFGKIGKVFSKSEANVLFGKVYGSETITLNQLREVIANADDYVYITIKHNQPIFTNSKRQSLIRNSYAPILSPDEQMIVFSKSALEDFLNKVASSPETTTSAKSKNASTTASAATVSVERRAEVTTLSSGAYTLEFALMCPPNCP